MSYLCLSTLGRFALTARRPETIDFAIHVIFPFFRVTVEIEAGKVMKRNESQAGTELSK